MAKFKIEQLRVNDATDFARDGNRAFAHNGVLNCIAGWDPNQEPMVNNEHYTYDYSGQNKIKLPNAPWGIRHEFPCTKGLGTDIAAIWGGDVLTPDFESVWVYNASLGWEQKTANWGVPPPKRFGQAYCKHNGYLYSVSGGLSAQDTTTGVQRGIYRTNNYNTWTKISDFPPEFDMGYFGMMTSFIGRLWYMGGGYFNTNLNVPPTPTNNIVFTKIYVSDDDGLTWTLHADRPDVLFAPMWANCCTTSDRFWFIGGSDVENELPPCIFHTTDMVNFERLPYNIKGRHATAICADEFDDVYIICGNFWNDMYKIKQVA